MLFRPTLIVALLLALAASHQVAAAQVEPGESYVADQPDRIDSGFILYPAPLSSRTAGFAAGIGYEIRNFPFPRAEIRALAVPGQHLGRYALGLSVGNAYTDALSAWTGVYYEATGRQWYYGMNTTSSKDNEIAVEKTMVEIEGRVAIRPLDKYLLVQPVVSYIRHDVGGYEVMSDGALERMDDLSRRFFLQSVGEAPVSRDGSATSVQEGISFGIAGGLDFRDNPIRPRRGAHFQGSARRYLFRGDPGVEFDLLEGYAYFYVPVRDNTLALRTVAMVTESNSDALIPFYLHPTLDDRLLPGYSRYRFYANDLLAITAEYSMPMFVVPQFAALDAVVSVGAGNTYLDLFRHFKPAITFDRDIEGDPRYPLRPSAALGLNLTGYDAGGWSARVLLGWGTEGMRLVRFAFVHDVRRVPLWNR